MNTEDNKSYLFMVQGIISSASVSEARLLLDDLLSSESFVKMHESCIVRKMDLDISNIEKPETEN